jgi:hypothetical protein
MTIVLLMILVAIQVADAITTARGIALGGEEANPFARGVFARLGYWRSVLLVKGAMIAAAVAVTLFVRHGWIFVAVLVIVGVVVLALNLKVLAELRAEQ